MRTCSNDGCERPLRARGLCSTHYNQAHQPNRHPKVTGLCDYCGAEWQKVASNRFGARFCSFICRDLWRIETGNNPKPSQPWRGGRPAAQRCELPPDHPARWCGRSSPVVFGECVWCGVLMSRGRDGDRDYCTERCSVRAKKERRRGREAQVFGWWTWSDFMRMARGFGYHCAYCGCKPERLNPDHVVPLSKGGANTIANILPTCMPCNSDKRDLSLTEWAADRQRRHLEPRCTSWEVGDSRFYHLTSHAA
jgi:5-methylcytosine-specific restriction endonuclease McrA